MVASKGADRLCRRSDYPVIAGHPIGEQVVNPGAFDVALLPAVEEEWTALPQEIGGRTLRYREGIAGLGSTARLHFSAPVHEEVQTRAHQPGIQIGASFGVARGVGAVQGAVDHVEMRVEVVARGAAHGGEGPL